MTALIPRELAHQLTEQINNVILKAGQLDIKTGQLYDGEYQNGLNILIRRIELHLRLAKLATEMCIREIGRGNPKLAEGEKAKQWRFPRRTADGRCETAV